MPSSQSAQITRKCKDATGIKVETRAIRREALSQADQRLHGYSIMIDYEWLRSSPLSSRQAQAAVIRWAKSEYPTMLVSKGRSALVVNMKRVEIVASGRRDPRPAP